MCYIIISSAFVSFLRGLWALDNSLAAFCLLCRLGASYIDPRRKILEHCRSKPEQVFGTCPHRRSAWFLPARL